MAVRQLYPKGHPKHTKDTPWVYEYTDAAGKRRRKTPKSGLKKDADAIARRIEREMDDSAHTPDRISASVKTVCDEYHQHMIQRRQDKKISSNYLKKIDLAIRFARRAAPWKHHILQTRSSRPGALGP